jgi:hypothetical protein
VRAQLPGALIQKNGHVVKVVPVAHVPVPPLRRTGSGRAFAGFCVEHLKHVGWVLSRAETYCELMRGRTEVLSPAVADGSVTLVPVHGVY